MNLHNDLINKTVERLDAANMQVPAQEADNNDSGFRRHGKQGHIIRCDGEMAVITATAGNNISADSDYWAVGQLISVVVGKNRIVGLIFKVEVPGNNWSVDGDNQINIHIELIGEICDDEEGKLQFNSGISTYPHLGASAHRIRTADLAVIYENNENSTVSIGSITQDSSIPALITIDKLLSRHFAVVGTTGVGKSTSVALILRKIVEKRPDVRTLILDPHNEFATAFPDHAIKVDAASLDLPFWMFTLEEFVEVIYRGRPGIGAEIDSLRDLIPEAKIQYENNVNPDKSATLVIRGREASSHTADTPVPYRIQDLLKLIDEKIGLLEGKAERPHLKALKNRIESIMNDPRFKFMFDGTSGAAAMSRVLSHVFRIPQNNKPICVFELSGLPAEVINVVASVMCRLAFDLGIYSQGTIQTLVVCEEAHRYIPANKEAGFLPTRMAIARIAKEGRKYGVYLGVITQRPGELDPTILSQCNTIFSMRLGNENDQEIVRQAITGAARSTASFLSSLANRECIAFGEAIDSPMRMMFEIVSKEDLPGSRIYENQAKIRSGSGIISLSNVINTMRQQGKGNSATQYEDINPIDGTSAAIVGEQKPSFYSSRHIPELDDSRERWPPAAAPSYKPQIGGEIFSPMKNFVSENSHPARSSASSDRQTEPAPTSGGGARTSNLIRTFRPK